MTMERHLPTKSMKSFRCTIDTSLYCFNSILDTSGLQTGLSFAYEPFSSHLLEPSMNPYQLFCSIPSNFFVSTRKFISALLDSWVGKDIARVNFLS